MIVLRQASTRDASRIAMLAEKIWRIHYPPIIGETQVEYMLDLMYSGASLVRQMEEGQLFYFIEDDGETLGYISVSVKENRNLFLHKFYIDPEKQGRGAGKKSFAELLKLYPEINEIRLTVNRKNYKSINFYFRLGFVIEEVKDFDIGKGYLMEDFVMLWRK